MNKNKEYEEYIGEYVTIHLRNVMTIVEDGEGNTAKMGFVEGYIVDVSDTHVRVGPTPEEDEFTSSIDFEVIGIIETSDQNTMGNLMANLPDEDEGVH